MAIIVQGLSQWALSKGKKSASYLEFILFYNFHQLILYYFLLYFFF